MNLISLFVSLQFLLFATSEDIKTYKIPNILTYSHMIYGGIYTYQLGYSAKDILVAIIIFVIFGLFGLMGMGDVKMYIALSLLNGTKNVLQILLLSLVLLVTYCLIFKTEHFTKSIINLKNNKLKSAIKDSSNKYPFALFTYMGYLLFAILSLI